MKDNRFIQACQDLPESYAKFWSFDITKKRDILYLNLFGLGILIVSWIGFWSLIQTIHPEIVKSGFSFEIGNIRQILIFLGIVAAVTFLMIVVHEGFHGVFFWLFSRSRPKFAFKGYYAYASAPDWYFPRRQYILIGLAPLIGITLLGIAGLLWLPDSLVLPIFLLLLFNTSGAAGDIWVVGRLLFCPSETLIRDFGDRIEFFRQARQGESKAC